MKNRLHWIMKLTALCTLFMLLFYPQLLFSSQENPLLKIMGSELSRNFDALHTQQPAPLYFLSYQITEIDERTISASYGAIEDDYKDRSRFLDVDVRVGSPKLDNTHEIRGGSEYSRFYMEPIRIGLDDNEQSIKQRLWLETERKFKDAQERFTKVQTNKAVKVQEEDTSEDFSVEKPEVSAGALAEARFDPAPWKEKLKKFSEAFQKYPEIYRSNVSLNVESVNKYLVNSEGTKVQEGINYIRLSFSCETMADDGMELYRYAGFDADTMGELPMDKKVSQAIQTMIDELLALRKAPLVEPYTGPAILVNRASGVFFHEIFGHRIEGHRQKSEMEGQTFTKKVGQKILPDFISIYDDPTIEKFNGQFLRGFYPYDDEGVKSEKVTIVKNGVLENFLMSRSPIKNFPVSNGHGRRQHSHATVSRQGNLMIASEKTVPYPKLRELLIEECKKQGKPYGLIFKDIEGGFTATGRFLPQSFKVIPLMV